MSQTDDVSNLQLAAKINQLTKTIDDLAESVQKGFSAMQEENVREHEETRKLISEKADLYEVVKHPEFDRLEQRVTQLELR